MPPLKKIKGRYEIKAKLGEGGMGVVYRAYDPPPMNRDVALKTLLEFPDSMSLELFYKECEVLKSMSHPNIVEIFDIGEFEDSGHKKPFFVMPLLPGHTLDELIRNASHSLTVERVVEIMTQTCRGLQAAHERGLVHRDLKPSNIFVLQDDSVKIIDFGVAHTADSRSRSSGFQKGTLLYMAPEQVQYKPASLQSDIFSLGVVCYEALTRRQPFRLASEEDVVNAILKYIPPPASDINPTVSQTMSRVVHKAMAKQPWNRFDSAKEFGETLQKALRNIPIEIFDSARIQPRIQRANKALEGGDYQFASEIVQELEAEGNIDPQLSVLRTQIDQVVRQRTIAQLLESARARYEEEEDPLALQKIQEILQLDPTHAAALGLKSKIDDRRSERQIDKWFQLARQHMDNHAYSHARQALQNVLQIRPKELRATQLLADIEHEEQDYLRIRQEKAHLYQSALNSWKNGEVSQALSEMGIVLELDRKAPDTSSPETSGKYQSFYNKVRSDHDAMNNAYAEARRLLAEREFAKALKICDDYLTKYPGHALFQALKFDMEEQQRQQLSAFVAEVDRRLEAEPDLGAKVNLLAEALKKYPKEAHFERSLKLMSDKRDLVDSIVAKARLHEERGQLNEALSDYEILRTIYSPYPGLQIEVERLQRRREQQVRDLAKAAWVEQIDRQRETGNYTRGMELLQNANREFPNDAELIELDKLVRQGYERSTHAEQLLTEGQELCAGGSFSEGLEVLKKAHALDTGNAKIRNTLRDVMVERAQALLESDWRASEALSQQALELDPGHPLARSLRAQALDRKRDEFVTQCATHARRLQAAGDLQAAIVEVDKGLAAYPSEPRLTAVNDTLQKELVQAQRKKSRLDDVEELRGLQKQAEAASGPELQTIFERTRTVVARNSGESDVQSIAREVERIVKARGGGAGRPPTPHPEQRRVTDPKEKRGQPPATIGKRLRPLLGSRVLAGVAVVLVLVLVGLAARHFWPRSKPHPTTMAAVPVKIQTSPEGATIRINDEDRGTSNVKVDLDPGDYQVEASLAGYETATRQISVKAGEPANLELALAPLGQVARIITPDLDAGEVHLDDGPASKLEGGSLVLPNLSAGQHILKISASGPAREDASITFQTAPGAIPSVAPVTDVHQLQVVVVSTKPGGAHVTSSLGSVAAMVDGKPVGQLAADGLQIDNLGPGTHELALGEGKQLRKMTFEISAAPGLDAILYSDRDVGSVLVFTGEDNVDVFVDGRQYPRHTQRGQVRIPNLTTTEHAIRVTKDGYQEPQQQKVAVVKGQEAKIKFVLVALPKFAGLALEHMTPGTQILLDDILIGAVGDDGTLSHNNFISPGNHTLQFSLPGYQTKRISRVFAPGETARLSGADVDLRRDQAMLEVLAEGNTQVTVSRKNQIIRQFTGSTRLSLDDGSYTITARANGGYSVTQTVPLASGESKTVDLRKLPTGMELWANPETWVQKDQWQIHKGGGFVLYNSLGPGEIVFTAKLKHGHSPFSGAPRLKWVVGFKDERNYLLFQLDDKNLYRTEVIEGNKRELKKIPYKIPEDTPYVSLRIKFSANTLVQRFSVPNSPQVVLDSSDIRESPSLYNARGFTEGKFGFYLPGNDEVEISNFTFYPQGNR